MRGTTLGGLRILVVEDEPVIAFDIEQTLTDAGAEVLGPACSVAQAVRLANQEQPDLAVLDWRLEQETSAPVAALLAENSVPFLFHTCSRGVPELGYEGVPIIDKPSWPGQLVAAVKALATKTSKLVS